MRYLPLTDQDRKDMLARIGVDSIDDIYQDVPKAAWLKEPLDLPNHFTELEVERHFAGLAAKNKAAFSGPFFVGAGAYRHHIPASVDHLIQRGEFLTSYTPYQPEISQGTLQYLFEFQTQVALLTGMDVANASLYDGSTGCAEAILMSQRLTRRKKAILSGNLHGHYQDVARTVTQFTDEEMDRLPPSPENPEDDFDRILRHLDEETSCVVVQNPDVFGHIRDLGPLAEAVHEKGALLVVAVTEVISLGAIKSPGEMGADIVVAEGQSIGNGLNFGGPYLGLFATREKFVRQMPGRLCGETVDEDGTRGYVLTLSTREQHIRREKATSNICTNSGLTALAFTIHMTLLGEKGLRAVAMTNHKKTTQLKAALEEIPGVSVLNQAFFNEISISLPKPATEVVEALAEKDVLGGVPASRLFSQDKNVSNILILAATELVTDEDISILVDTLKEVLK